MSRSSKDRIYDLFINQRYAECHSIDTMSNGSISLDLGDMWHHGYPVSPQWEGGLELDSASDCDNANFEVGTAAAQDHATESGPKDYISVVRESSRLPHTSYFDEVHSPHCSIWDLPQAIEGVLVVPYDRHVVPLSLSLSLSLSAIEETLHGTIRNLISPLLTTDDFVKCRTVAGRWNVGCRYGELGDIFFEFLENDPFVRQWYRDVKGNSVFTKSMKNKPFVESFRQWVLHAPEAAAVPCEVTSLGEAGTNLMNDVKKERSLSTGDTLIATVLIRCREAACPLICLTPGIMGLP